MATIDPTVVLLDAAAGVILVTWANLTQTNSDVGKAFTLAPKWVAFSDKSVQLDGVLGSGGTCIIEGSNQYQAAVPTYATLHDPQGNALSLTALGIKQVLEVTGLVRPRISAGDGTTSLTVSMIVVKHGSQVG